MDGRDGEERDRVVLRQCHPAVLTHDPPAVSLMTGRPSRSRPADPCPDPQTVPITTGRPVPRSADRPDHDRPTVS
ncbi:hypothetical protein TNCT6_74150 [Streptomyces sp. 6-11-2]|nr:hypothetical protein TNCT6_74150 [Streptomyces sp. 6-11-2]